MRLPLFRRSVSKTMIGARVGALVLEPETVWGSSDPNSSLFFAPVGLLVRRKAGGSQAGRARSTSTVCVSVVRSPSRSAVAEPSYGATSGWRLFEVVSHGVRSGNCAVGFTRRRKSRSLRRAPAERPAQGRGDLRCWLRSDSKVCDGTVWTVAGNGSENKRPADVSAAGKGL